MMAGLRSRLEMGILKDDVGRYVIGHFSTLADRTKPIS
jgi:hypothetical protein